MLASVLEAWDRAIGSDESAPQVVITSPIAPLKIPAGWTVIRVGEVAGEKEISLEKAPELPRSVEKLGIALMIHDPPIPAEELAARDAREREALNLPKRRGRSPGKGKKERCVGRGGSCPPEGRRISDILPSAEVDENGHRKLVKVEKAPEEAKEKAPDLFDPFA
jgi:hypothetical protein